MRSRVSAYIYGDVLVLATVLGLPEEAVPTWAPVIAISVTTVTTFLAHVLAGAAVGRIGPTPQETETHTREELRDAVPIATAGVVPVLLLGLATIRVLPDLVAQASAAGFIIGRLAVAGVYTSRVTGRSAPLSVLLSGLGLAMVGLVIAAIKAAPGH